MSEAKDDYAMSVRLMEKEIEIADAQVARSFVEYVDKVCGALGEEPTTVNSFGVLGQAIYSLCEDPDAGRELAAGVYEAVSRPDVLGAVSKGEPHKFFPLVAQLVQRELANTGYQDIDLKSVVYRAVEEFSE
jgi:hypothetical protein